MPVPTGPAIVAGGVCAPWTDPATVLARHDMTGVEIGGTPVTWDADEVADACLVASGILYALSGRQFPGACTSTVRPYGDTYGCRHPPHSGAWEHWDSLAAATNGWAGPCSDGGLDLGLYPVQAVTQVKIGGETLDPSAYRVDGQRWLVRPGAIWWPIDQRLDQPDTEIGTFSVTAVHGQDPPPAGARAASTLAANLAKSWVGATSSLPKRVTSLTRQQVSVTTSDPASYFDRGLTGIVECDLFISTYNAGRQRARPLVWSPDIPRRRRI